MVIDTHIHPALFAPICEDQERFRRRCDAMNYHLMKPSDMALLRKQYALADIGRVVLWALAERMPNSMMLNMYNLYVFILFVSKVTLPSFRYFFACG